MPKPNRRQSVLAILLVGAIAFLVISIRGSHPARRYRQGVVAKQAGEAAEAKPTGNLQPAAPADTDFTRYASLASSNIFSEARSLPPPQVRRPTSTPPFPTVRTPPRPLPPDLSGWSYAGCVTFSGDKLGVLKFGIIQNEATFSVDYLAVGDTFMGATVEALDQESIRIGKGAASTTLNRPRDFPIAPLSRVAVAPAPVSPSPDARGR